MQGRSTCTWLAAALVLGCAWRASAAPSPEDTLFTPGTALFDTRGHRARPGAVSCHLRLSHAPCATGSQLTAVSPSRHRRTRAVCKRGCLRVGGGAWRGDASREWAVLLGGRCAPARGGRTYRTLCIHSHMQNTRNTSKSQTVWQRAQSMERPSFRRASTCTPRRTWGPGRLRARY